MKLKILNWFVNGEIGCSSKAIACCVANIKTSEKSHPVDPADFNRCLLFLASVPEARQYWHKVKTLSSEWNALVKNWAEIESLFLEEAGFNWEKADEAPKTFICIEKTLKSICQRTK